MKIKTEKRELATWLLETYDRLDSLERLADDAPYYIRIEAYDEGECFRESVEIYDDVDIKDILDLATIKLSKKEKELRRELAEDLGEKDN